MTCSLDLSSSEWQNFIIVTCRVVLESQGITLNVEFFLASPTISPHLLLMLNSPDHHFSVGDPEKVERKRKIC